MFSNKTRITALAAVVAAATLGAGLVAPAASAADSGEKTTSDATLSWGLSKIATGGAWFGGCNFLSAGEAGNSGSSAPWTASNPNPGYKSADGNVTIKSPDANGDLTVTPTWETKCLTPSGKAATAYLNGTGTSTDATVNFSKGTGTIDTAANTADIQWTGSFTVAFYGGMTYWFAADPELKVNADGTATLTADLSGYAADRNDTSKWSKIPVQENKTIAELKNVKVTDTGFTVTPEYDSIKTTEVPDGGSWPQDFVSFQDLTGQASYWYNSGASDPNAKAKAPTPITIAYTAETPEPPATAPAAPGKPTVAVASTMADPYQVKVDWKAPSDNGGSAITGYTVTLTPSTGDAVTQDVAADVTTATFGKLTAQNVSYTATVVAKNDKGASAASPASDAVTPNADPTSTPTVTVTPTTDIDPAKDTTFTVKGTGFTGGAAFYGAYAVVADASVWNAGKNPTGSESFIGSAWVKPADIKNGEFTTTITVKANTFEYGKTYVVGTTAAHGLSLSDRRLDTAQAIALKAQPKAPEAPAKPGITLNDTSATVTWTAPADNGSAITGYTVTLTADGGKDEAKTQDVAADQTSATFENLAKGVTYKATVVAKNAEGVSAQSEASDAVTVETTLPSAPQNVTVKQGAAHQLIVGWTAPADNGGAAITGYTVTLAPAAGDAKTQSVNADTLQATFDDLDPSTAYTASVAAKNEKGASAAGTSDANAPVNPAPIAPKLTITDKNGDALAELNLKADGTATVKALLAGEATDDVKVEWVSSNAEGVKVEANEDGSAATITALKAGAAATVTAKATIDGQEKTAELAVSVAKADADNGGNNDNGSTNSGTSTDKTDGKTNTDGATNGQLGNTGASVAVLAGVMIALAAAAAGVTVLRRRNA